VGIDGNRKWFDLAVDTSIYNYTSSLNQSVYAYIGYVPEGRHFNGSVDIYPPATNNRTSASPVSYADVTSWPVLRIEGGGSMYVGQYLWVRLLPTGPHAISFIYSGSLYPTVRCAMHSLLDDLKLKLVMASSCAQDLVVEDVTLYSSPRMGIVASIARNLTLRRYNVLKKGKRYGSLNVDCVHLSGLRGRLKFEDSLLEGSGDDGLNIHNQNAQVLEIVNGTTLSVAGFTTDKVQKSVSTYIPSHACVILVWAS
jgi:hypothetical protein